MPPKYLQLILVTENDLDLFNYFRSVDVLDMYPQWGEDAIIELARSKASGCYRIKAYWGDESILVYSGECSYPNTIPDYWWCYANASLISFFKAYETDPDSALDDLNYD